MKTDFPTSCTSSAERMPRSTSRGISRMISSCHVIRVAKTAFLADESMRFDDPLAEKQLYCEHI